METVQRAGLSKCLCASHSRYDDEGFLDEVVSLICRLLDARTDYARYHWSVEYFEDLRNVNHCEFIVMKQSPANGKYILENELRTWSELKKRAATGDKGTGGTPSSTRTTSLSAVSNSPQVVPMRRWGGCANGCDHDKISWPKRVMRKNTADFLGGHPPLPASAHVEGEKDDSSKDADSAQLVQEPTPQKPTRKPSTKALSMAAVPPGPLSPNDASDDASGSADDQIMSSEQEDSGPQIPRRHHSNPRTAAILRHLQPPERATGEGFSDDSDYFPGMQHLHLHSHHSRRTNPKIREKSKERKAARKMTEKSWMQQSGMYSGARADTLGDGDELSDVGSTSYGKVVSPTTMEGGERMPILKEALKGDMEVANSEEQRPSDDKEFSVLLEKKVSEEDVENMKEADRKSLSEVY